jgi:hypothetical protein
MKGLKLYTRGERVRLCPVNSPESDYSFAMQVKARKRSSKLTNDGSESLDSHLPISSRLSKTLQNTPDLSIVFVILAAHLHLIDNFLSLFEDLADSLVVALHSGLNLDKVNVMLHDKLAGIEVIVGFGRGEIDGFLEIGKVGLDVVVQIGKSHPLLHALSETVFFVSQFQKFLVQKSLETRDLGSLVAN